MKSQTFSHLHTKSTPKFNKAKVAFLAAFAYIGYEAFGWLCAIGVTG
jgi:hypothetical protein